MWRKARSGPRVCDRWPPNQQAALNGAYAKIDRDHEGRQHHHPGKHARDVEHAFGLLDQVAQARRRYSPTTAPTTANPTDVCRDENIQDSADGQ
jgi:hypothetical protein